MALWRIEACAAAEDTRWLDFPIWADVVVRAPTAAQARLVAAGLEEGVIGDETPTGNESLIFRSGFQDEKLYHVRRLRHFSGAAEEGPSEVVSARQARPASRT